MNSNQVTGVLRAIVPAATSYAVAKGWIPESAAADVGTALLAVGAAAWSVVTNIEHPQPPAQPPKAS